MSAHAPGPCQTLAMLAIQSKRYQEDMDFRDAVDAVLNVPVYDAAPEMLEALVDAEHALFSAMPYMPNVTWDKLAMKNALEAARAAIAKARGGQS